MLGRIAPDDEETRTAVNGGDWMMAWHPPVSPPPGQPFGANAFCLTGDGAVVLISPDGVRWGWPGGRPEPGESREQVLRRDIAEEACARIAARTVVLAVRGRLFPASCPPDRGDH